jgi:7-carboxy-7-deazaguanine synthase
VDDIVHRAKEFGVPLVELTGGEPLIQQATPDLVRRLCDEGYEVLVETGGHHDISALDPRSHVILDVKAPGSAMDDHNDLSNLDRLRRGDEVKIVLTDRADYEWARDLLRRTGVAAHVPVHLSPCAGMLDPRDLADWILADGLRARLNLQIHKWIWGPDASGV